MGFLAFLSHFWPVFGQLQSPNGRQTLVNCVYTPVLVRFNWKTQLGVNSELQIAKKCIFTPKMAKNWLLEMGAQKYPRMEVRFMFSTKKMCWSSEVSELYGNFYPTLKFLPLRSLTNWDETKLTSYLCFKKRFVNPPGDMTPYLYQCVSLKQWTRLMVLSIDSCVRCGGLTKRFLKHRYNLSLVLSQLAK